MKLPFFAFLFSFCTISIFAQDNQKFDIDHTIASNAFGDERKITVYLPQSYYDDPKDKFTVTYVLDGHFDPFIDLAVKTIEYNTYMYNYTPTIVVGIHAKQRGWEFSAPTPGDEDDENYKGGRAPELQQHFKNEVFPLIDSLYGNKLRPFRNIIGHSSGGAFVLYSLFSNEKDLFDGYLAVSPGIREDSEYILENAIKRLEAGEQFNKFLYCSSGTVGEREEIFGGAVTKLDSIFKEHPDNGLIWKTSKFEGMDHWTCVPPSFNTGMVEVTRAFRVDEKTFHDFAANQDISMRTQIESFYENKREKYGFVEIPDPRYIKSIAWELMDNGKHQASLDMYDWGLTQFNKDYTLTRARAILLLNMDQKEEAMNGFNESLSILEEIRETMSDERYEGQKEYLTKKLKACSE